MMRMKNRKLSLLSVLVVMLISFMLVGFDSEQSKVYDNADLLTTTEEDKLQELCVSTAESSQIDIIILTIDDNNGKKSMTYAEDFFMANDFGYDSKHGDAILLLIDMDAREAFISTSGSGITYFSDKRIDNMITAITSKLSNEQYYSACETFVDKVGTYMKSLPSSSDTGGNGKTTYTNDRANMTTAELLFDNISTKAVIALVIAIVVVVIMMHQSKAHMTVGGQTYAKDHNYDVRDRRDIFVNTTVVKHKIETNNNSGGGGGSSHSGSGGHSFGGGGGKF